MGYTCCDETGEGARDERAGVEERDAEGEFFAGVPGGEKEEAAGEVGGFDETKEEAVGDETIEAVCACCCGGDAAPYYHNGGEVDGGFADAVEEEIAGHLHENVAHEEDGDAGLYVLVVAWGVVRSEIHTSYCVSVSFRPF